MEKIPIQSEVQSLSPTGLVEMFIIDTSHIEKGTLMRFHSGTAQGYKDIVWQGETYQAIPIEAEGFDITAQGTLPRPKLRVANIGGLFSAMAVEMDDLINAKVTRKQTFVRYLDAVNFAGGNPEANPDQYLPDQLWFVDRKTAENRNVVEWELASAFDLDGIQLPYRQIIKNTCPWRYRSSECGYTGGFYDLNDQPTTDINKDCCPKRLGSCTARQGVDADLTYGGFPGADRGGQ